MKFPKLTHEETISRLEPREGRLQVVLDTDTFNEVDDQFALAYALRSKERIDLKAVYAAPFYNDRSAGPLDGMEKSYDEILKILKMLNVPTAGYVFKGSEGYLENTLKPQRSEAAEDLVNKALSCSDAPLYVAAIGAITNVASAILMEPEIIKKIVVVWLGGHSLFWKHTKEFNLKQDVAAARLIFDCGVPLVHIPCFGVTTHLLTTIQELDYYLHGKSTIGTYLSDIVRSYTNDPFGWSKVIWDISAIAWLVNPSWVPSDIVHSPLLTDQVTWSFDNSRHFIRSANFVQRDKIFADLFKKLG